MILTPFLDDGDVTLYHGDCIEVMRELPTDSIDAIITDPPYGLEFMGKEWDKPTVMLGQASWSGRDSGALKTEKGKAHSRGYVDNDPHAFQAFSEAWAREAIRILKPGGHLLAFAGTRTYHRMASGVEDAGFEIRDCIAWMYGSGFPKSLDVSKAIDKAAGAERERLPGSGFGKSFSDDGGTTYGTRLDDTPITPAARKWNGWGTALKPAYEPIVIARKPLIGTVAQNVLEHGTGAINVDGCRIGTTVETWPSSRAWGAGYVPGGDRSADATQHTGSTPPGRWPANVTLDETAATILDEQSGIQKDGVAVNRNRGETRPQTVTNVPKRIHSHEDITFGGNGGASRFFYTAKASRTDRNTSGANNTHPTVKPTSLMRWLIRLVTPPGGIILDPFGGSGTTGVAAREENTRCILIERETEYLQIIQQRLAQLSLFSIPDEDAA